MYQYHQYLIKTAAHGIRCKLMLVHDTSHRYYTSNQIQHVIENKTFIIKVEIMGRFFSFVHVEIKYKWGTCGM